MKMNVHFRNVSKPKDVQILIDCTFKDTVLDLCNGVEHVDRLISQFRSNPKNKRSEWPRIYRVAFNEATRILTTREKEKVYPVIEFT